MRFTKELQLKCRLKKKKKKKGAEEVGEGEQRGCSLVLLLSLLFTVTPTLIISTMICKVFAPVGVCQAGAFSVLHGLPTQQVARQQRIDLGGTPHDPSLLSTWGSPQAGILLHSTPQQLSARLCSACSQATATAAAAAAVVVVVPVG